MYKCIFFILSYIILAILLGIAKKKEPLIVIDEEWEYLDSFALINAIRYFDEEKTEKNKHILYQFYDSYYIVSAVERFQRAKHNYDNISHNGYDLQGCIGYICLMYLYLLISDPSSLIVWLCIPAAIIIAIIIYQLTVKFSNRNLMRDVIYIEFVWNDNKAFSPKDFDECYDFLRNEKSRCISRLTERADAYEQALYRKKYYLNVFRWASVFFVFSAYLLAHIAVLFF